MWLVLCDELHVWRGLHGLSSVSALNLCREVTLSYTAPPSRRFAPANQSRCHTTKDYGWTAKPSQDRLRLSRGPKATAIPQVGV